MLIEHKRLEIRRASERRKRMKQNIGDEFGIQRGVQSVDAVFLGCRRSVLLAVQTNGDQEHQRGELPKRLCDEIIVCY